MAKKTEKTDAVVYAFPEGYASNAAYKIPIEDPRALVMLEIAKSIEKLLEPKDMPDVSNRRAQHAATYMRNSAIYLQRELNGPQKKGRRRTAGEASQKSEKKQARSEKLAEMLAAGNKKKDKKEK